MKQSKEVFTWLEPAQLQWPMVLSVPHAGTGLPDEIREQLDPGQQERLDDTDWFVDRLYSFAYAMGIPVLRANYHRWVIDLNRSPDQKPLYSDGRVITGLCSTTDFLGNPIYRDGRTQVSNEETASRKQAYFDPYHHTLRSRLEAIHAQAGAVLLWDCHSIRRYVPAIHPQPFPDFIVGSVDGTSASQPLIETALASLQASGRQTNHNFPFKGGYITRAYGRPAAGYHALQLEMSKTNYLDDMETRYHEERAAQTAGILKKTLVQLARLLPNRSAAAHA